jgi:acetyl-CoA carboxylase, biotin carboxylase subunit
MTPPHGPDAADRSLSAPPCGPSAPAAPGAGAVRPSFAKLLVANRGEIALRVMRACRELGIATVAVYSEADRTARHVRYADEAYLLGPAPSAESYLRIDRLVDVALQSGAQAVHPGYGFLAENAFFVEACEAAGLVFVGPGSRAMRLLGSKTEARRAMLAADVPVIPGSGPLTDAGQAREQAERLGYPVMVKAAAGGGGKGMRQVEAPADIEAAFTAAKAEAAAAFGDDTVYVEKVVVRPRHVEFQVLADVHGAAVHLGERECSVQRRHQKLIEESPCAVMTPELRARMGAVAVRAVLAAGYANAGTVEFLLDSRGDFYFLEVNARLQVEHPVTELITGLDLVKAQLRLAAGEALGLRQQDVTFRGAAIECRICAEDPFADFLPSIGVLSELVEPAGPGVRLESALERGQEITPYYDPLIAKLITWGVDRAEAIARMRRALSEYRIQGIATTIPFHQRVMDDEQFVAADIDTGYVERRFPELPLDAGRAMGAGEAELSGAEVAAVVAGMLALRPDASVAAARGPAGAPRAGVDPWMATTRLGARRLGGV